MYHVLDQKKIAEKFSFSHDGISPYEVGIPLVEMSDPIIEQIYYFRWHTYCKHLKKSPFGWVVTEFLPDVPWAGKHNTISCAAGHHIYEGRWMHEPTYLQDYGRFWFSEDGEPRRYSFWVANALYAFCSMRGDFSLAISLLDKLKENYGAWERDKQTESGLFWQLADRDGMEKAIGGDGCRPTINSYMYGDACAISKIAEMAGDQETAQKYREKAEAIKALINQKLWDADAEFYKTAAQDENLSLVDVREEIGFVPWYFGVPTEDRAVAWKFLNDPKYFQAPFGPTTAEQTHPDFMKVYRHECWWNGPSWPFATSQTLTALGNLLCDYKQSVMTEADYFDLLKTYANSHFITTENGERVPFIDENIEPFTGEWLARSILRKIEPPRKDVDRGRDYNHSTFCDLVLNGLAGIRVNDGDVLEIHPLFAEQQLDYFCADGILYQGHALTVLWDKNGDRYQHGRGLHILLDGELIASAKNLQKIEINLNALKK